MCLETALKRAAETTAKITIHLHEQTLNGSLRSRAGLACLAVAVEHQNAIVVLLEQQPPIASSAFALIRPVFESYIRGLWLLHCATDAQLDAFLSGERPPDTASLVNQVENVIASEEKQLLNTYKEHWGAMCAFTHTGDLQVQRWNTAEAIEPAFEQGELVVVLEFSAAIAFLAGTAIASQLNDKSLANELLRYGKVHFNRDV